MGENANGFCANIALIHFSVNNTIKQYLKFGSLNSNPYSCGKFSIGLTHQQFVELFFEHCSAIDKAIKLSMPPKTFVSALAKHIFYHLYHYVKFNKAKAISKVEAKKCE